MSCNPYSVRLADEPCLTLLQKENRFGLDPSSTHQLLLKNVERCATSNLNSKNKPKKTTVYPIASAVIFFCATAFSRRRKKNDVRYNKYQFIYLIMGMCGPYFVNGIIMIRHTKKEEKRPVIGLHVNF